LQQHRQVELIGVFETHLAHLLEIAHDPWRAQRAGGEQEHDEIALPQLRLTRCHHSALVFAGQLRVVKWIIDPMRCGGSGGEMTAQPVHQCSGDGEIFFGATDVDAHEEPPCMKRAHAQHRSSKSRADDNRMTGACKGGDRRHSSGEAGRRWSNCTHRHERGPPFLDPPNRPMLYLYPT